MFFKPPKGVAHFNPLYIARHYRQKCFSFSYGLFFSRRWISYSRSICMSRCLTSNLYHKNLIVTQIIYRTRPYTIIHIFFFQVKQRQISLALISSTFLLSNPILSTLAFTPPPANPIPLTKIHFHSPAVPDPYALFHGARYPRLPFS